MSKIFCPSCYSAFEVQPEKCTCGYPFNENEIVKQKFMSMQRNRRKTLQQGVKSASYSRNILFIIGALNLLASLILAYTAEDNSYYLIMMIYSVIIIGLGFYSYKEPFLSLLFGFIFMLLIYIVIGFVNPAKLLSGIFLKIIFIVSFIYGLIKIKQAENINKNK